MTTYEQELCSRLNFKNYQNWFRNHHSMSSENYNNKIHSKIIKIFNENKISDLNHDSNVKTMKSLSKLLDKSIFELYEEINPITVERLNNITIEQWKKWAEKYHFLVNDDILEYSTDVAWLSFKDENPYVIYPNSLTLEEGVQWFCMNDSKLQIELIAEHFYLIDEFNYLGRAKAIHDLVWELENI